MKTKKDNLKTWCLYSVVLFNSCLASGQNFSVGESQVIISQDRLQEAGIGGIDASLYALNDDGQWKWFCTSRWKHVYSLGPRDNPFENAVVKTGQFENLPDRYTDTREGFSDDHRWGNITWIANVYRNPENGHILSFVHVETAPKNRGGVYFNLGMAISKDGGASFKWCGQIIKPELSFETWSQHWQAKDFFAGFIYPNTGLANYIIKDGYFYLYYTDTRDKPHDFVNGMAVARANVDDVLAAAENLETVEWHKYYYKYFYDTALPDIAWPKH